MPEQRGRAFGFHRAMDTTGAFIGVLVAAALLYALPGWYRTIFVLALVPGLGAVALTFRVREAGRSEPTDGETPDRHTRGRVASLPAGYWRTCVVLTVFALANSSDTFLLLRAHSLGLSDSAVVLTYALYNLTYALVSYPAGVLSDRLGRWKVIALGWLIYAGVYAGFAVIADANYLWLLFLIYGVYMGLTQGVGKALVVDFAPSDAKGTALGIFHFATGFGALTSSLAAGWLWDRFGPQATFGFGAVAAVASLGLVPLAARMAKK